MTCPHCQQHNRESAVTCAQCGGSLRATRADLYLKRAEAALDAGDYRLAGEQLTRADGEMLSLAPATRKSSLLPARALWVQSCIYYAEGRMTFAEEELQRALAAAQEPDAGELRANILNKLGNIAYYEDRLELAAEYMTECAVLATSTGLYAMAAKALSNIAVIADVERDSSKAESYFLKALVEAEMSGDAAVVASINRGLASFYTYEGPFSSALLHAEQAMALRDQISNLDTRCQIICETANVYTFAGDLYKAESYLREAERLLRHGGGRVSEELFTLYMAELLWRKGELAAMMEQLLKLRRPVVESLIKGGPELLLARYYAAVMDRQAARRHLPLLGRAVAGDLDRETLGTLYYAQALLYAALDERAAADATYQQALAPGLLRPYDRAEVLVAYAAFLRQPDADPQSAIAVLHEAASLYRQLELPHQLANVELTISSLVNVD